MREQSRKKEGFLEVYQVRPKYRDVASRVEAAQPSAEAAPEAAPEQPAPEK